MARVSTGKAAEALGQVPLFEGLSEKQRRLLGAQMKEVHFSPGKEICVEGERGAGLHVILEGRTKVDIGGSTKRRMGPGDFFGEIALLDDQPRSATVTAETEVKTISLPAWHFKSVLKEYPSIAIKMLEGIAARLRERGSLD